MRFFLAGLLAALCFCNALRADDSAVSVVSLLKQETDFSTLPMHRDWRTNLSSSHDPTGGNADAQQFVSLKDDHAVLADLKGPGAIVRFWSTAVYKNASGGLTSEPSGWLKIFIDDNPKPVIDEPFTDFFDQHPPFTKPLTDHYGAATISYFPIPYAKHCLVTLDKPQDQFYQIQSLAFPEGTQVKPFALPLSDEEEKALDAASAAWNDAAKIPPPSRMDMLSVSLPPGKIEESAAAEGPGIVKSFMLFCPEATNLQLRHLILRAWFDGHKTPDLECPVADFFGNAYGHKVFNSFFLQQEDDGEIMTCRFPMPYRSSAHFSIENRNTEAVQLNLQPSYISTPIAPGTEYFHADFNQEITKSGRAHAWLKIAKQAGHFVGVVQTMQGNETLGYCEGDGQVRVDEQPWGASQVPTTVIGPWNGTGTEDDFNSAWYFQDGIISRPLNGCLVRQDLGRIDCYRFFLNDAPVWQDSIDAQIEIGGNNDGAGLYYSSVAFWYGAGERVPMQPFPDAASLVFPTVKFNDRNLSATVIEGESALDSAHATCGQVAKEEISGELNAWSGGAQLAWTGAKKGDTLDFVINIPRAGDYNLTAYVGHGPDYAAYNVSIAGKPLPFNENAYEDAQVNVRQDWGSATLPAGPCHITVRQLNTDGRSKGTRFGLDVLDLFLTKPASP